MGRPNGFSLIELLFTLSILVIMASITIWQMNIQVPRYRTNSAASRLVLDVRKASAIATRTNRPVTLTVNPSGCNPGYALNQGDVRYDEVCFAREYPGVGLRSDDTAIACASETAAGFTPIPPCSLCAGTSEIRFLPTGEVITPSGLDESLILGPTGDGELFDRAVGIRNVTGKTRAYRRGGAGWVCP